VRNPLLKKVSQFFPSLPLFLSSSLPPYMSLSLSLIKYVKRQQATRKRDEDTEV
jgi:hypothetical protein